MSAVRHTAAVFLSLHVLILLTFFVDAKLIDMKVNLGGEAVDGFTSEEEIIELPNSENIAKMRFHGSIKNGGAFSNVFRTQRFSRYEDLVLNFPVPDGVYHIELLFAETWKGAFSQGKRVFDVYMGSKPNGVVKVLSQFDPFREGGPGGAIYKKFEGVTTQDGLTVALRPIVQNPQIAGVIIKGYSYSPALIEDLPTVAAAIPPSEDFGALNNIGARLPADTSLLYDPAQNPKFKNSGGPPSSSSFVSTASPPSATDMSLGVSGTQSGAQSYGSAPAAGSSVGTYGGAQSGYGDTSTSSSTSRSSASGYGTNPMGGGSSATGPSSYNGGSTDGQAQGGQGSQPSQYGGQTPQYGAQSTFGAQGSYSGGQSSQYGGGQVSQYGGGQAAQYGGGSPQFGTQNSQYGGAAAGYGQAVYRRRLSSFPEPEGASSPDFPVRMEPANQPMMNMQGGMPSQWSPEQNNQRMNSYINSEMPTAMLQNDPRQMRLSQGGISPAEIPQEVPSQNDTVQGFPRGVMTQAKIPHNGISSGMAPEDISQYGMSQTEFSQGGMSQGEQSTGGMIPNPMAQGESSQQRLSYLQQMSRLGSETNPMAQGDSSQQRMSYLQQMSRLGSENNPGLPEMPGMGNTPDMPSQDVTGRSLPLSDSQQEYANGPSPSPATTDSTNGMSNIGLGKSWTGMSSMANSQGIDPSVQHESQVDIGVPTASGPAADLSITQSTEGRDVQPHSVSSSMDGMTSAMRSSSTNDYGGQTHEKASPSQNILSHREFQAQSERMQQAMDAAAAAAAMVGGSSNDEPLNQVSSTGRSEAVTESTNDVGGFGKGVLDSRYNGNYGPIGSIEHGRVSNDFGKESTARYEMADGAREKAEPANGIISMQYRDSQNVPSRDSIRAKSVPEAMSGPDGMGRMRATNTEQFASNDNDGGSAGRWGGSRRGLRSGELVNAAVQTAAHEEPVFHSPVSEIGNRDLSMGRTAGGTTFVDAGRGALQSGEAGRNGMVMGASAGIHNGDQQLDGICLNNQTHCSCGEVAPDPAAGERCLFVKNEDSSPMICVRGPCSGKWKCGCSPGANNMCVQSFVKSILVAVPGRSPSPENDIVLCRREALDEGMYVLTPVL